MSLAPLVLTLMALQAASQGDSIRPTPPAGLSWEDSDQIAETVARLERRLKAGKPASRQPIAVNERQVNSYVRLGLGSKIPPALSGLSFRFEPGRLVADGILDLEAVRSQLPQSGPTSMLAFLTGTVPIALKGRFEGANGEGRVAIEEALVAGISLPPSLLSQLVAQATRSAKEPEGFDLLAPFPLPWTARTVRLEAGRAVVEFAQD